jgi:hypothetical protein
MVRAFLFVWGDEGARFGAEMGEGRLERSIQVGFNSL